MKKKLTFQEIHEYEVGCVRYFVGICEKYNLRYFLAGGSLLGAVRHRGFIPWDDDIDILMPRPDYDKLQEIAKSLRDDRYSIASLELENLNYPFCKIFDTYTETKKTIREESEEHLWIDILPLDGVPDNDVELEKLFKKSLFWRHMLSIQKAQFGTGKSLLKRIFKPFLKYGLLTFIGIDKTVKKIDELARTYDFDNCDFVAGVAWGYGPQEKVNKSEYLKIEKMEFETELLNVPGCWDYYLSSLYGNYMKLPPIEQRENHMMDVYDIKEGVK